MQSSKVAKESWKGAGDRENSDLNEEMNTYIRKFEHLKIILNDSHFTGEAIDKLSSRIDELISKFKNDEFQIAIVGVVKAGKSTLINSIIGKELASTSNTPETAVLTKFRAGFGRDFIRVKFYSSNEWEELWNSVHESGRSGFLDQYKNLKSEHVKNQWIDHEDIEINDEQDLKKIIEEWTSSRDPKHLFVKEVEVGIKDFDLPGQIVLVDTPGLNDVESYRSNITKKYLNSANTVLLCVRSDALNAGDLQNMYPIFNKCSENPEKLYIIGTKIDQLNNPINDWTDIKRKWITYFDGPGCYNSRVQADNNIIGVSPYIYNLSRSYESLTTKDKDTLKSKIKLFDGDVEKDPISEVERISNVLSVRNKIFNKTIKDYQTSLVKDIKYEFNSIKEEIRAYLVNSQKQQQGLLTSSNGDLIQIEQEYEATNKAHQNILRQKNDLQQTMSGITRQAEEDFYLLKKNIQKLDMEEL
ncbi:MULTISPECIES: dynamin family protein [unclassified Bacillus cereus group]|uniref:dynamin family protein n=1 Tax=unclassified Bacillus cereus group TaxID=2750818 RepID=UPI0022E9117A|nr:MULTISPECIES: dynamin family protein [unclassified Bacillus cereus group]MDA2144898.1 dynamin family protein [Bacillus cereus group sp. Bc248]MDA2172911.1 dynamin family protein [Bacillus cereus group sp. Bc247]